MTALGLAVLLAFANAPAKLDPEPYTDAWVLDYAKREHLNPVDACVYLTDGIGESDAHCARFAPTPDSIPASEECAQW